MRVNSTIISKMPSTSARPHIYISALPFAPSESRISTTYGPKFKKTLTVLEGRRVNWDPHRYTKYVREGKLSLVGHDLSTRPTEGRKGAYFLTCGRYSIAASSLADARELIQVPSVMPVLVARILAMRKDYSWFVVIREDKSVGICRWDWALRDRIRMAYEPIIASDTSAATFVGNEKTGAWLLQRNVDCFRSCVAGTGGQNRDQY